MTTLATKWRAVWLFYRGVAPAMLSISGLLILVVQLPSLFEGWAAQTLVVQLPGPVKGWAAQVVPKLLLAKLLTAPAVWYLSEQLRPHQYWLYYNLGVSRRTLWGGVVGLDALLFLGVVLVINALFAGR